MVEDPKWELAILATVQGFYEKLLQDSIGGEVPVPAGLEAISLQEGDPGTRVDRDHLSAFSWAAVRENRTFPRSLRRRE